jgi:hypothetical protein
MTFADGQRRSRKMLVLEVELERYSGAWRETADERRQSNQGAVRVLLAISAFKRVRKRQGRWQPRSLSSTWVEAASDRYVRLRQALYLSRPTAACR